MEFRDALRLQIIRGTEICRACSFSYGESCAWACGKAGVFPLTFAREICSLFFSLAESFVIFVALFAIRGKVVFTKPRQSRFLSYDIPDKQSVQIRARVMDSSEM